MKYNFKAIKDLSSQLLFENVITTTDNLSYNKFLTEVKKSPILKAQYIVYTNIESERFTDKSEAERFLQENINLFSQYTKSEILKQNENLVSKLPKSVLNEAEDLLFDLILESTKDKKVSGMSARAKLFTQIVNKLMEPAPVISEEVTLEINPNLPLKKVIKRATEILNEKFSFLSENEITILKAFMNNDDGEKEKLYNNLINENLKLVKRKLYEEENYEKEEVDALTLTEEKLKNSPYSKEILIGEFSKLISLQQSLKG